MSSIKSVNSHIPKRLMNALDESDWIDDEYEELIGEDRKPGYLSDNLPEELLQAYLSRPPSPLTHTQYFNELLALQRELIKLQDWVVQHGEKIAIIFEGRDAAGKGGAIKRFTQRLNPRVVRVVALNKPSERERTEWYFQRYVQHLPAGGEIVLFDRSWYNRCGVERVMKFATEQQVEQFFQDVPEFERMLVRSGIRLFKYWFSITDEEQQRRFLLRLHDPLKQWKLSAMDLQARVQWEQYTKAKEQTFARTNIPEAPWRIVDANDQRTARLNYIADLLEHVPYKEVPHNTIELPDRVHNSDYERQELPAELYVKCRY